MKYKLINYTTNEKEDVTFGTCEMCMSTGSMTEQIFHIQDEYGRVHEVEGHEWDWGDLSEIYIDNIPKFAAWLEKQDIEPPYDDIYGYDYGWLNSIADNYYDYSRLYDELLPWIDNNVEVDGNKMMIRVDGQTYHIFNGFDFDSILYHVKDRKGLDVDYDSFKPSGSNIFKFNEGTESADFSLHINYREHAVEVMIHEYDESGYVKKYNSVYLGDVSGKITIQFKENGEFPDFSYQQW